MDILDKKNITSIVKILHDREARKSDWRIYELIKASKDQFADDIKNEMSEETTLEAVGVGRTAKGPVFFTLPSITAMMLNISHESWTEGQKLLNKHKPYRRHKFSFSTPSKEYLYFYIHSKKLGKFFDALEKIIQSYIFAYSALEHFANMSLPDNYTYSKKKKNYNRQQVERLITLDEKLSTILPAIYKIEEYELSKEYINLKKIRDNIIHFKSQDFSPNWSKGAFIWTKLVVTRKEDNPAFVSKNIVGYFLKNSKNIPPWFIRCPF